MNEERTRLIVILLIVILLSVVADITIRVLPSAKAKQQSKCLAVPTKFIMEHPDCADKLVQAANLTNIRIVSSKTLESGRYDQSVEADNTNVLVEVNHATHPKVCIEQWRQELISTEDTLRCIDEYIEREN